MSVTIQILGHQEVLGAISRFDLLGVANVKRAVNTSALNVQRVAKRNCPVDTGRLRSSIRAKFYMGGLAGEVFTDVDYAPSVEYGSVAHIIRPKTKKALRWFAGAGKGKQAVFAKVVHHPGTRPRPFMTPAWEQERPNFVASLSRELKLAASEAGLA